jgi:hypothetical protein
MLELIFVIIIVYITAFFINKNIITPNQILQSPFMIIDFCKKLWSKLTNK